MINKYVDLVIIGGGPAGLAAASSAKQNRVRKVLVIDRNDWLGGILPQCIHDGFGVEETGISMTGPEYADMYITKSKKNHIEILKETMAISLETNHSIIAVNREGVLKIHFKALILATGCRERTRWDILIPGTRPSGIYTAGVAQSFINLYNIMPGHEIVILGSGDVGLIMARRLTLEGANVKAVVEIQPYPSALPRNVVQCLHDYNIPLYLNHTVSSINGKDRLENVIISEVDSKWDIIEGTEKKFTCDTLLLSLGLIPENELSRAIGIDIDPATGGPIVNQDFETNTDGIYACGNCLQVYDTVDMLALDAKRSGLKAAMHIHKNHKPSNKLKNKYLVKTLAGKGIRYVIPQNITKKGVIPLTLRVQKPYENVSLKIKANEQELLTKKLNWANPANMIRIELDITEKILLKAHSIEVLINE